MASDLEQVVESIAELEASNGKFDGFVETRERDITPCFRAEIDAKSLKTISLIFNPRYDEEKPNKITTVVRDITRHEVNHKGYYGFKGCPRTVDNHVERILEPIGEVLFEKGYSEEDAHYVSNALEDTILQTDLSRKFNLDGQILFWEDVGRHLRRKINKNGIEVELNKFTPFYEAFVKLNLCLWGNKKQKRILKKYFTNDKKIREVLQNFLERTGISEKKQKIIIGEEKVYVKDRKAIRDFLNNKENWPKIAKIFAEEFSKLMQPNYALPLINHSGKGTRGKENGDETRKNSKKRIIIREGNAFDIKMRTKDYKKKRIRKAYNRGEGIPIWISEFEALDLLYQSLAQELQIKKEVFTKQTKFPIYRYGKKPFDPERDKLKHAFFDFNDRGEIELKTKRWHEDIPLEYKIQPKGFPEIKFCIFDTSGSMERAPDGSSNIGSTKIIPWGDNSKYHYALLAWYGLLEYLKKNNLLKEKSIFLTNFSDDTLTVESLTEAKELALSPQFGVTELELYKIKKIFEKSRMLVFTVSDGEIQNWDEIKSEFIKYAKKNYYFHIQIGSSNTMTEDLIREKLTVVYIENIEDLAQRVIDLTRGMYYARA